MLLKFKTEISLLLLAILVYVVSAFCYFYEGSWKDFAIPLAGVASALLVIAGILYSKRR
jgi:uncharacterized protein (UPF0333 family)